MGGVPDGVRARIFGSIALVALLLLLASCHTVDTYVPNAVVILNPTPGQPSIYNGVVNPGVPNPCHSSPPHKPCPGPWPPPQPGVCQAQHRVQWGDTVSGLAVRYQTTVWAITQANSLKNPNLIFVGQVLCIPPSGKPWPPGVPTATPAIPPVLPTATPAIPPVLPTATPPGRPTPTLTPPPYCVQTCTLWLDYPACYRVRPGDTLDSIASQCNIPYQQLYSLNSFQLDDAGTVYPNQELVTRPR